MKKKAEDLKPGDVLAETCEYGRRVVCKVMHGSSPDENLRLRTYAPHSEVLSLVTVQPYVEVEVESPALTPAQQHAEELLSLARDASSALVNYTTMRSSEFSMARDEIIARAKPLLARIDPPKPPTLEETLVVLRDFRAASMGVMDGMRDKKIAADDLLARAVAADLIK